uniref:Putative pentatricopeptide repeat-containing protein At3g15200 n=1 Tax=Anthurium amnicola TaxID=1678845 RepID=A0A1D1ZCG5_9ARAE
MLPVFSKLSETFLQREPWSKFQVSSLRHLKDIFPEVMMKTRIPSAEKGGNNIFACLQAFDKRCRSINLGQRVLSSLSSNFMVFILEEFSHRCTQTRKGNSILQSNLLDAHQPHRRLHAYMCTEPQGISDLDSTSSNLNDESHGTQLAPSSDYSVPKDDFILKNASMIQKILKYHGNSCELGSALDQNCFSVTEDLVLEVLRRHRSDWKLALSFFNWASGQQGYSHGSRTYNEMFDILGRMKQIKIMRQMFTEIPPKNCGSIVNEKTFAILMNRYAASHKVRDAIDIFFNRKEHGLELDLSAFQTLLASLCRYKHVEEAESLFLEKQLEFPPVIKSRNIILNGWCVLGSLREVKRFWNDIITSGCKPDLYTYGIFINSLTKAGKLATAVKLFSAMWTKGCNPDVTICNCIIDALCFKKKIPDALLIFEKMNERGCLPDVATYNSLIKHICKIRRMEKAYELLDEMEEKGCTPNARTYTYFFKTMKNHEEVVAMVSRMKRNGCKIDGDTYNLILNLYVRWGNQQGILSVWMEMERSGLGPDQRSYTVMIHGLHSQGKLDEAERYYIEMQSKGLIPEPRTRLLIKAIELKRKNE